MHTSVEPVDATRREDFFLVHSEANGEGWCNCVAWWAPTWDGWERRTAEENRALRERLFDEGHYDGYLLYVDGAPVGWCQCGPRDRLVKLRRELERPTDPDVWAVTCFVVAPKVRGRGLAHRLLAGVLDDLRSRGVGRVEAYPRPERGLEPGDVWMGPEAVYLLAGFVKERDGLFALSLGRDGAPAGES